jgi:membrane-associated phospholipid phosphatase
MAVLDVLWSVTTVVVALHALAILGIVGRTRLRGWRNTLVENVTRSRTVIVGLAIVLLLNKTLRDVGVELSWLIGLNATGIIYAIEGTLVAHVQSLAAPSLTAYFGFMYVYGYVFLLTFPVLAYALHEDWRALHVVLLAYALNYAAGLVCYVLFVAYGPRNFMPDLVQSLLYVHWPDAQLLTSRVNRNTNVFPSLHTSLSVTVALVARRYRALYPRWLPVAVVFAGSITVATVYLGIHWVTDVVAGGLLAVGSVTVARRFVPSDESADAATESLDDAFEGG